MGKWREKNNQILNKLNQTLKYIQWHFEQQKTETNGNGKTNKKEKII